MTAQSQHSRRRGVEDFAGGGKRRGGGGERRATEGKTGGGRDNGKPGSEVEGKEREKGKRCEGG